YMALQYGIRAANYPLTDDDMERLQLPAALRPHKHKLFGLTIDPDRLASIRNERRPNSRYASFAQCEFEIREVENLFRRENIPHISPAHCSGAEISAKMLVHRGIERRLQWSSACPQGHLCLTPLPVPTPPGQRRDVARRFSTIFC